MSQASNRWIIKVILALCLISFVAVSIVPIIAAFNDTERSPTDTAAKGNSPTVDQKSKLQDEVRGYELVLQREPENQAALKGLLQSRLQLLSLGQGDVKGVIEPLEKLVKLNPEETRYAVLLAQAKQQTGDKEGAATAYRTVLTTKPGDLQALQGMVALLLQQKRPEAAIGLLQDTLSKAPQANKIEAGSVDTIAVQVLLGNIHASQKRFSEALSVYDKSIKSDPLDFRPVLAKAIVLKEQGKVDEAKPLFDKAATLAPAQYKDEINKQATAAPTPTASATPSDQTTPKK